MSFTTNNHYVPQWYQQRFIPPGKKERKFWYRDLTPERITQNDHTYTRDEYLYWGPVKCFQQVDLYTLRFEDQASDVIEKRFFGRIDDAGARAVEFFINYDPMTAYAHEAFGDMLRYMDAQKIRTPKGLDLITMMGGADSHLVTLGVMQQMWQLHGTIWAESVWEVVRCDNTETKFIISDHPVTTYNRGMYVRAKLAVLNIYPYPTDPLISQLGTQTIFPLSLDRCLVLTNLGYARDPEVDPVRSRENPRYFAETLIDVRKVQQGRQLTENEVRAINYIIKRRAKRYVAGAEKEWLTPERYLPTTSWDALGDEFFLMPDPRKMTFSSEIIVGYGDGTAWGVDEHGRPARMRDDPRVRELRDREWDSFQRWKEKWQRTHPPIPPEELRRIHHLGFAMTPNPPEGVPTDARETGGEDVRESESPSEI